MLTGHDILIYTYADWHATWSTPQQIAARLTPHNRVLYVDVPRSILFRFKPADPQGAGRWSGPRMQEVRENLHVYHPPHAFAPIGDLPFPLARRAMALNGCIIARQVTRRMRRLGFSRPILWNFSPLHGKAVMPVSRSLTIYDVCDEWVNYVHHESGRRILRWIEEELCQAADLVFVGTENARKLREHLNPETHVVHHAADYDHFAKAALPETAVPEDIAALPRPIIGSIGVMDPARFDVDLFAYLARERPAWSFAIVGPARADMDVSLLRELPNVHLLGNREIEQLPGYLKGMDAVLIPYKINEATRHIYPLKLQEYLASGKPVVSSAMPAVLPYGEVVSIAEDHQAFLSRIEAALAEDTPVRRNARQAVARANSWEQRIAEKSAHILRRLEAPR